MNTRAGWVALGLLMAPLTAATADDAERYAMSRLRLTTEPARTKGCTPVGSVSDDSLKDLRRKILRLGGDTALLTFGLEDLSTVHAQVFRCPPPTAPARPSSQAPPAGTPPPPPGPPPPPPPR